MFSLDLLEFSLEKFKVYLSCTSCFISKTAIRYFDIIDSIDTKIKFQIINFAQLEALLDGETMLWPIFPMLAFLLSKPASFGF